MSKATFEAILRMPREMLVYGTLKRGRHNHTLIKGAEFLGTQSVPGKMFEYNGIPFLVGESEAGELPGEVVEYEAERYRVNDKQMLRVGVMELMAGYQMGKHDGATIFYYPADLIDTRYHRRINEF